MKVFLIRHGETINNSKRVHQSFDAKLSEKGIKQAEFVAERFHKESVELIVSSHFYRAKQTAEIISKHLKLSIVTSELFKERKRPTFVENKPSLDPEVKAVDDLVRENYHNASWRHSDEENFLDIKERAVKAVKYLEQIQKETILVVTHGTILRIIVSVMLFGEELTSRECLRFQQFLSIDNTGVTLCEYKNQKWKLITWNDQAHLAE